jgi:hypothetical protein
MTMVLTGRVVDSMVVTLQKISQGLHRGEAR